MQRNDQHYCDKCHAHKALTGLVEVRLEVFIPEGATDEQGRRISDDRGPVRIEQRYELCRDCRQDSSALDDWKLKRRRAMLDNYCRIREAGLALRRD